MDSDTFVHIVLLGDTMVGKSAMVHAFKNPGQFSKYTYDVKVYNCYKTEIRLNDTDYNVRIHDFAGHPEYKRTREHFYSSTKIGCFILCYSVNNPVSFTNIINEWLPEIHHLNCPMLFVGTKNDLVPLVNRKSIVQSDKGERLSLIMNGNSFLLCSAQTCKNINKIFADAVRAAVFGTPKKRRNPRNFFSSF